MTQFSFFNMAKGKDKEKNKTNEKVKDDREKGGLCLYLFLWCIWCLLNFLIGNIVDYYINKRDIFQFEFDLVKFIYGLVIYIGTIILVLIIIIIFHIIYILCMLVKEGYDRCVKYLVNKGNEDKKICLEDIV